MAKYLVSINDLPPDGKSFNLTDQEIWLDPIREFKMDCRIEKPLEATISVQPAEDGCLVRGAIGGEVVAPCNRCAENARIGINAHFDEFEEIPSMARAKAMLSMKGMRQCWIWAALPGNSSCWPCRSILFAGRTARGFARFAAQISIWKPAIATRKRKTPEWRPCGI